MFCHDKFLLQYDTFIVSLIDGMKSSHFDLYYLYSNTKPCENEEDLCNPIFGRITTGKDGIFERTTKKKVETPRKKRTLFNKVSIINNFVEHAL